jgi:hypothetical protein
VRREEFDGVRPGGEQGSTTDGECVAPATNCGSGELRRRTAISGDLRCTGERVELEREASSGRQEKGEWLCCLL